MTEEERDVLGVVSETVRDEFWNTGQRAVVTTIGTGGMPATGL
jgi:hypothetical protein